jgi:hypothetical protein
MKKECYRKSPECGGYIFHRPEGKRPEAQIDPDAIWKEACGDTGYSFVPELGPEEICFNHLDDKQWDRVQKTSGACPLDKTISPRTQLWARIITANSKDWVDRHVCRNCAFFALNGYDLCGMEMKQSWFTTLRCRGYVSDPSRESKCGVCSDYISLKQWAEILRTPIDGGQRSAAWDRFKSGNLEKQNSIAMTNEYITKL